MCKHTDREDTQDKAAYLDQAKQSESAEVDLWSVTQDLVGVAQATDSSRENPEAQQAVNMA